MEMVEWPPHANMRGNEDDVRGFLATMLKARIDSKGAELLLLLGEPAAQWLLNEEQRDAVSNGQVDILGQVTALLVPSLQDMIDKPECKRQTWQTIRYLSPMRQVHKADS
jgi:uracil-DNA glycosylase